MEATMLSRPSFSIRKLVSQRRPRAATPEEVSPLDFNDSGISLGDFTRVEDFAWESPRKSPPTPLDIRLSHRLSTSLPPQLSHTRHSSASSLCSCCDGNSPTRRPANRSPPLCLASSKTFPEDEPRSQWTKLGESGRQSNNSPTRRNEEMNQPSNSSMSTFNLLEALTLEPDSDVAAKQAVSSAGTQKDAAEWSDNVQQLIRETDEAFKAVGTALEETRVATPPAVPRQVNDHQPPLPRLPSPNSSKRISDIPGPPPPAKPIPRKQPDINPTHLKSPTRTSSISKTKRKRSQKKRRPDRLPWKYRPSANRNSRWALPENVSEFINERLLFNRIEADEVLSPRRLHQIRTSQTAHLHAQTSTDTPKTPKTAETDGSDTPIEPFHLDDLPSRIGAAGVRLSVPSTIAEVPSPPRSASLDEDVVQKDFALPSKGKGKEKQEDEFASDTMTYMDHAFPTPPTMTTKKSPLRRKPVQMPTIPEGTVAGSRRSKTLFLDDDTEKSPDYVYLKASPYSLTMPTFRHGAIRIAKAELGLEPKLPDDTLDWTAFQMAILGGAGDFFSESTDFGRHSAAEQELDGIVAWIDSLGLEGGAQRACGRVIRCFDDEDPLSPMPLSPLTETGGGSDSGATPSPATEKGSTHKIRDLPIPIMPEHPSGFWNEGDFDTSRFLPPGGGCGIRRWTVEGHPKRYSGVFAPPHRRESTDSLPQSPMLDLVVSRAVDGEEYVVPMGYNLGHDLGDYLAWESEQMWAGAVGE